jgi:predicted transcriptional regulator
VAAETLDTSLLELATELTMAWLSNPNTRASAEEVPAFLQSMHGAVASLAAPEASAEESAPAKEYTPAVTARHSLASKDHIISLIDGKPYKTLKRHLSGHGLTPAEYRERLDLKSDYPMVAESYAEMRDSIPQPREPRAQTAGNSIPAPCHGQLSVLTGTLPRSHNKRPGYCQGRIPGRQRRRPDPSILGRGKPSGHRCEAHRQSDAGTASL